MKFIYFLENAEKYICKGTINEITTKTIPFTLYVYNTNGCM